MAVMEGLGRGSTDNGLMFSLNAQLWSIETPLVRFGTEDQKRRYLPRLCSGEIIGAHGMTEPGSGSDAFSLTTRAERRGDTYVLSGRKTFIPNAPSPICRRFATTDPSLGWRVFDIPRRSWSASVAVDREEKDGLRTRRWATSRSILSRCGAAPRTRRCRCGDLRILDGVEVGDPVERHRRDESRARPLCAYAKERRQFRQPIAKFPAVLNRLADMKVRLEASRALLRSVAEASEGESPAATQAAIAKLFVSEAWVASSLDAQQVYGAFGYMRSNSIEREVRDALASRIYSGTSDIQRVVIARALGL